MLYHVDFHIEYPAGMSQTELFAIWTQEAEDYAETLLTILIVSSEYTKIPPRSIRGATKVHHDQEFSEDVRRMHEDERANALSLRSNSKDSEELLRKTVSQVCPGLRRLKSLVLWLWRNRARSSPDRQILPQWLRSNSAAPSFAASRAVASLPKLTGTLTPKTSPKLAPAVRCTFDNS